MLYNSANSKIVKAVRKLLKSRGLSNDENWFVSKFTNNKTSNINKMPLEDLQNLHSSLEEKTVDYLINGIYEICFSLNIIFENKQTLDNEKTIQSFLNSNKLGHNKPFNELTYPQLYMTAVSLGNKYLQSSQVLNN